MNFFVRMCYDSIRSAKPWVKFGVSPRGIWKNDISEGGAGTAGIYFYRMEAVSTSNLENRFVQRSEFLTMACVQGKKKMGDDVTPGIMNSVMHYSAKELKSRSAFDLKEVGKSQKDAWSHERVYFGRNAKGDGCTTLRVEFLLTMRITSLDFAQTEDFMSALTDEEHSFLDDLTAGYTVKEISQKQHIQYSRIPAIRTSLQEKAVAYR